METNQMLKKSKNESEDEDEKGSFGKNPNDVINLFEKDKIPKFENEMADKWFKGQREIFFRDRKTGKTHAIIEIITKFIENITQGKNLFFKIFTHSKRARDSY